MFLKNELLFFHEKVKKKLSKSGPHFRQKRSCTTGPDGPPNRGPKRTFFEKWVQKKAYFVLNVFFRNLKKGLESPMSPHFFIST